MRNWLKKNSKMFVIGHEFLTKININKKHSENVQLIIKRRKTILETLYQTINSLQLGIQMYLILRKSVAILIN